MIVTLILAVLESDLWSSIAGSVQWVRIAAHLRSGGGRPAEVWLALLSGNG